MSSAGNDSRAGISYRNGVLTVICGLLALLCMRDLGTGGLAGEAYAQRERGRTVQMPPNAAEQRLRMIEELKGLQELKTISTKLDGLERTIESRLGAIESRLSEQAAEMRSERRRGRKEVIE